MIIKVKIKKVHPTWNHLYDNEFTIGDELDLDNGIITAKSGRKYNATDLCRSYSNRCSYPDIFTKVKKKS